MGPEVKENNQALIRKGWLRVLVFLPASLLCFLLLGFLVNTAHYLLEGIPPGIIFGYIAEGGFEGMIKYSSGIFGLIGMIAAVFLFTRLVDRRKASVIGYKNFHGKRFLSYLSAGLIITGFGFLILNLLGLRSIDKTIWLTDEILASMLFYAFAAITEELLFRGYVLRNLTDGFNRITALMISAVIFSTAHIFNPNFGLIAFLNITLAGFALGVIYLNGNDLWSSTAFHFGWNFSSGTIFGFSVSGISGYSIILQADTGGSNILTGGVFGFESSVLCTFFLAVFIIILLLLNKNKLI